MILFIDKDRISEMKTYQKILTSLFVIIGFFLLLFYSYQVEIGKKLVEVGIEEDCKDFELKKLRLENSFQKETFYLKKEGNGLPIILFPGGSMESTMLCVFSEIFNKEKRPLYILEHPGHGKNKSPSIKTLKKEVLDGSHWAFAYGEHAQKVLDSIGLNKFDLIGYSLGGGVASFLMAKKPKMVNRAVLIAPAGVSMVYTKRLLSIIKRGLFKETYAWETLKEFDGLLSFLGMDPTMVPQFIKKGIVQSRLKHYGKGYWPTYFNSYKNLDITYPDRVLKKLVKGKKLPPILVIGMEKDQIIDVNNLPAFSKLLGAQFTKVLGSGHAAHSKREPLINNFYEGLSPLIKAFLKEGRSNIPKSYGPIN